VNRRARREDVSGADRETPEMSLSLLQQVTLAPVEAELLDGGWATRPDTAEELGAVLREAARCAGIAG